MPRPEEVVGGTAVLGDPHPAGELFERLLERGITIAPGPMFSATQRYRNCMRVSLGQAWSERYERALREIGRLAQELAGDRCDSVTASA